MSRRASNNNVSLFPFLAVLVCAMGALILLLLVTTRRIRSQQIATLESQTEIVQPAPAPIPEPVIELPEPEPEPAIPAPPEKIEYQPSIVPIAITSVVDTIPSPVTDDTRRTDHVQRDTAALRGYDRMLSERLNQWATSDQQLHDRYKQATAGHKQLVDSEKKLNKQYAATKRDVAESKETKRLLEEQLAALRRAIAQKESEPVNAVSKFRIVPFDGISGTVRHPIMIECVGDRFRFLPEDIELTKAQLESFVSSFNPLLSGAAALNAHWAMREKQTATVGEPYILLVVRPSGSLGFYAAKRMLRRLDVPIGYELLGEEQELDRPIADPEAVQLCRLAVERTLARRDEIESIRPMADALIASAKRDVARRNGFTDGSRSSQTRSTAQGLSQTPPGNTGSGRSDARVESFQRMIAGMRTQNAQRPPGLKRYPQFTPGGQNQRNQAPRSQKSDRMTTAVAGGGQTNNQNSSQSGTNGLATNQDSPRVAGGSGSGQPVSGQPRTQSSATGFANGSGQTQLRGRTVAQSGRPTARELAQFPGFRSDAQTQNNLTGNMPGQPGAARMSPPRLPAPQPAAPSNSPLGSAPMGTMPIGPGSQLARGPNTNGARPTSITDGSTKPVNPTGQQGQAGTGRALANGQAPPAGFANLNQRQPPQLTLFRRAVDLFVDPNSVIVANNTRINVAQEEVTGPWLGAILTQIEAEVRSWGPAPAGTTWAPEVRFRISPGANRTHTRLRNSLKRLGMRTTDEFTIAPRDRSSADVFRGGQQTRSGGGAR